jgi:hypothetical protein
MLYRCEYMCAWIGNGGNEECADINKTVSGQKPKITEENHATLIGTISVIVIWAIFSFMWYELIKIDLEVSNV